MLQGKLVALRAVEKEDLEQIKEWLSDPELLHALGARPIPLGSVDPEKLPDLFRLRDGRVLAILSRDRHLLGLIAFGNIHEYNRTASLMVMIGDRAEWNRGYGSDAVRIAARFAFEDLNLNCVEVTIPQYNTRAMRMFQKVGFEIEGSHRARFFGRGKYWDLVVASALRSEWTGEAQTPSAEQAEQTAAAPAPPVPVSPEPAPAATVTAPPAMASSDAPQQ